jgi:hypothetical protein
VPAPTGESSACAGWFWASEFWASKNNPESTTQLIDNSFFMKNPATSKLQPTLIGRYRLDADRRGDGFPYSTLDRPFSGEKARNTPKAGGTGALDG